MHICALQSEANVDKQQTFRRETTEQKGFTNCGKTREKLTSNSSKNCGGKFVTFSSLPMRIHEKRSKQNYRRSKMVALHVERKTREKKNPKTTFSRIENCQVFVDETAFEGQHRKTSIPTWTRKKILTSPRSLEHVHRIWCSVSLSGTMQVPCSQSLFQSVRC